ncbi:MAG: type II secretion system protein M [Candidatus Omnitrophica bacterium]|nr:type II secretion system protein M [Candidatus Omnitrophota bacterium]MBU4149301.1 type II secretion system protein M [Candidatus Omnitrophota bacterium]
MFKTAREKVIVKQGIVVLAVIAGLYFFVLSPFLKEGSSILDEELERKTLEIKKYISRTGILPSKEDFEKLRNEKTGVESRLEELIDFIDPQKTRVSEASSEAGLYFIERLHSSVKKFSESSSSGGVKIPENLGFGDGLPREDKVDSLLRQLETVELAVEMLLKNDEVEFSAIKPLKVINYIEPLSKEVFYTELPVQISLKTNTGALIKLLLGLKNATPMVSVKEVHVRSDKASSDQIEVSLVLSAFKIARAKNDN